MTGEPALGIRRGDRGVNAIGKLEDGKRVRVVLIEPHLVQGDEGDEPKLDDLRAALVAVYGTDFGVHDVTWLSRFTDMARQAACYRERRVLLAGDAAHVHAPTGGQGLNIGVQDAVNLGWKLAQVVNGTSPESLLDTYQAERHPIGARVLQTTMAQTALNRGDDRTKALRETISDLLEARRASQALRRDDVGPRHSLRPRRGTPAARTPHARSRPGHRRAARGGCSPCCTRPDRSCSISVSPAPSTSRRPRGRIGFNESMRNTPARGSSRCSARSLLPSAVLIRPDGHVAWVGEGADQGLRDALTSWFGPPDHG